MNVEHLFTAALTSCHLQWTVRQKLASVPKVDGSRYLVWRLGMAMPCTKADGSMGSKCDSLSTLLRMRLLLLRQGAGIMKMMVRGLVVPTHT